MNSTFLRHTTAACLLTVGLFSALPAFCSPKPAASEKPALYVLLVVDQLRDEQINKFSPYFLSEGTASHPGGFNYLIKNGSQHRNCHHASLPTYTAVGHAAISTGAPPYTSGIIGNYWYDRDKNQSVNAVGDPDYPLVGLKEQASDKGFRDVGAPHATVKKNQGYSPKLLEVSTIGDELKLSTNGQALVYSLSLKDRAAILLGGHSADLTLWYDYEIGQWTTSRWFAPQGTLPNWVEQANQADAFTASYGWTWNKLLPEAAYKLSAPDTSPGVVLDESVNKFPYHFVSASGHPDAEFRRNLATSPQGNTITLDMAEKLLENTQLGRDEVPDLLCINLASYDRVGHGWGPNSSQLQDTALRLDRDLAKFLTYLNKRVGLNKTVIAVTGDHGCGPNHVYAKRFKLDGQVQYYEPIKECIETALSARYGKIANHYVSDFSSPHLYLNRQVIKEADFAEALRLARQAVKQQPGVAEVYLRDDILQGRLPHTEVSDMVSRSFHHTRGGALFIMTKPFWSMGRPGSRTSWHGSPWAYDTQVPLIICGPTVKAGQRLRACTVFDIAATFSIMMGITQPAGCEGRVLEEDF